jgi:cysteine desulfurase
VNTRAYFDWNATAPLKAEARTAMISVMSNLGNPSSIHTEGRAAKAIIDTARMQLAEAFGASNSDIIFTSGATEAATLALNSKNIKCSKVEHPCISSHCENSLTVDANGKILISDLDISSIQSANSETGILQDIPAGIYLSDFVQSFCKISIAFEWTGAMRGILSAHKIGGPKGVGALVVRSGTEVSDMFGGGGQEMGRRSGTENVIGIAGFGAAVSAANRDLENGVWEEVSNLRDLLEEGIEASASDTIFIGRDVDRLPNTSCISIPGWSGETAVMQLDLAGYAISSGSACSSGSVSRSEVLNSLGYDDVTAGSAIRVSLGPYNTEEEVLNFVDVWSNLYKKFKAKAA